MKLPLKRIRKANCTFRTVRAAIFEDVRKFNKEAGTELFTTLVDASSFEVRLRRLPKLVVWQSSAETIFPENGLLEARLINIPTPSDYRIEIFTSRSCWMHWHSLEGEIQGNETGHPMMIAKHLMSRVFG